MIPCRSIDLSTQVYSEKYLKKLIGNTEAEDSLQRLDKLTQEEARMASAELLKITHRVEGKVKGVDDKVEDVRSDVQDVGGKVLNVDDKLDQVNRSSSPNLTTRHSKPSLS